MCLHLFCGEPLRVVRSSLYLGICVSAGIDLIVKVNVRMVKTTVTYSNLRHIEHRHGVRLAVKG